jgi:acyl carrier protein
VTESGGYLPEQILHIARSVLGKPALSLRDNFFEYGSSIDVVEFYAQIEDVTGLEIPMEALWEAEDLDSFSIRVMEMAKS